jgi:hypothetical protein
MIFNVFQLAYAVPDIRDAVGIGQSYFGIPEFQINLDVPIETRSGVAKCHFALAFIGETQIELIQPAGGADAVYRDALPTTGNMRLHHVGVLIRDSASWTRQKSEIEAAGLQTPVGGDFAGLMHYLYADTRADLGHYIEYMYQTEAGADLFDAVPKYPASVALR